MRRSTRIADNAFMREIPINMQPSRVVFVHGAGGGGWEWHVWRRVFAAHGWCCCTPDLLPADGGPGATRFDDYVGQVVATMQAFANAGTAQDARKLVLIGASLGGLLAIAACARATPAALVLINALPPAGSARATPREYADVVPWGSRRSLASTLRALPDADDAARLFAFRHWRDESGAALRAAHEGIELPRPSCPTLVLASECDDDVPLATSRHLAAFLGAELRVLAGASHAGPLLGRAAAACANDTLGWIRGTAGSAHAATGARDNLRGI